MGFPRLSFGVRQPGLERIVPGRQLRHCCQAARV